jgi:hypothetical protein
MLTRIIVLLLIPASASAAAFEGFPVASAEELDRMRGGFTLQLGENRFDISFGIERAIFVNGELASATRLQAPVSLVQGGAGNTFADTPLPQLSPAVLNVVQNRLDDQLIRQMTVIDARVRALEAFAAQRIGAALNAELLKSMR